MTSHDSNHIPHQSLGSLGFDWSDRVNKDVLSEDILTLHRYINFCLFLIAMARVMGGELACKYSLVANNFERKDMTVSIDSRVFSYYRHSLTIVVHVCFEKNPCDQG